jgi:hypothetical protein
MGLRTAAEIVSSTGFVVFGVTAAYIAWAREPTDRDRKRPKHQTAQNLRGPGGIQRTGHSPRFDWHAGSQIDVADNRLIPTTSVQASVICPT